MRCRRSTSFRVILASVLLLGSMAGCAATPSEPDPQPLSVEEAELFAVTRFHNFDLGTRSFTLSSPDAAGEVAVSGYVDFPEGFVYGAVTQDDNPVGLLKASAQTLSIREQPTPTEPILPIPEDGWLSQEFDPSDSALAGAIAVLVSLGSDRPENPQLLRQSDAVSLGTEDVSTESGSVTAHVLVGPSASGGSAQPIEDRAHYWVLSDGTLLRVELPRGDDASPVVIEFADAEGVDLGDGLASD
ncbi:hypothetical protein [Microbacterium sp. LWH12-1.2]|uniref:hypothetical protein n=1 Tax=Microbacterium sp. LWH12-1.2 TaxID=3135259 RepID=UPI0034247DF1